MEMCGGRPIYVVVEGRRTSLCWACGAARHLFKAYPGKKQEPQSQPQNAKKNEGGANKSKAGKDPGGWSEITKKGGEVASLPTMHSLKRQNGINSKRLRSPNGSRRASRDRRIGGRTVIQICINVWR